MTGLHDLHNVRAAALASSTSSEFLRKNGIAHRTVADLETLMTDLAQGRLDALVSDAAVLKYTINRALLKIRRSPEWQSETSAYIGK